MRNMRNEGKKTPIWSNTASQSDINLKGANRMFILRGIYSYIHDLHIFFKVDEFENKFFSRTRANNSGFCIFTLHCVYSIAII